MRFRRAFAKAFDRPGLVASLGGLRTERTDGFLSAQEPERLYNPEWARQMLTEAGYQGQPLKLYTFVRQQNEQDARWIQSKCREVGIPVELTFLGAREFQERQQEADLLLRADMIDEHAEFSFCRVVLNENGVIRNCLPSGMTKDICHKMENIRQQPCADTRLLQLQEIEQQLKSEAVVLFLYHEQYVATHQPYVQGISQMSTGMVDLKNVWLKR